MKHILILILSGLLLFSGCSIRNSTAGITATENSKENKEPTVNPLETNQTVIDLYDFLRINNTTGFIMMQNGEILLEEYWGKDKNETSDIYSAGKSICSVLVGISIEKGYFKQDDRVSSIIGNGFSNMPKATEDLITVKDLLSMTSGLDNHLLMENEPGVAWDYSDSWNLLFNIIKTTTHKDINTYAHEVLLDKIGMNGSQYHSAKTELRLLRKGIPDYPDWAPYQIDCSPLDMANFGQFILQKGNWNGEQIVSEAYLNEALNPSSEMNPAYGYLFWLNSASNGLVPESNIALKTNIIPEAPADLVAALGAGDKKIYIIPSLNMVIVRQGSVANEGAYAFTQFDNEFWRHLNKVIDSLGLSNESFR